MDKQGITFNKRNTPVFKNIYNMKVLIVVSNYNEEKAIYDTIQDLKNNSAIKADILVIDNFSSDNSIEIIKELGIDYLIHPVNSGGSAGVIKTAFFYAWYHNYHYYCHMDGDNQHSAAELTKILNPLIENSELDIIVGSRFIERQGFQSLFFRRQGIMMFSKVISLITGNQFTDITSGFRAYNRKAITFFAKNFKQEIETVSQLELVAHFAGLKRIDVPVMMKPRLSGKSEINFKNAVKFPVYNLISIIGTLINRR